MRPVCTEGAVPPCTSRSQVTIYYLPAPTFVLFCQLAASTLVVKAGGVMGVLEVDDLEWSKVRKFIWWVVASAFIYCDER